MVTLTQHFERLDSQQRLLRQPSSRGRRRSRRSSGGNLFVGKKGTFEGKDTESICSAPAGFNNTVSMGGVGCGGGSSRGIRKRRTSNARMATKTLEEELTLAGLVSESTNTTACLTIESNTYDAGGYLPHGYHHSEVKIDDDDDDEDDYSVTSAYTTVSCGFRPEGSISLLVDIGEDELIPLDLSQTNQDNQASNNSFPSTSNSDLTSNPKDHRDHAIPNDDDEQQQQDTQQMNGNHQGLSGWMQGSFSTFFQETVDEVTKTVEEETKGGWESFLQHRMNTFKTNIETLAINASVTTTDCSPPPPPQSLLTENCSDSKKAGEEEEEDEEAVPSLEEQLLADDREHVNLMGCDVLVEAVATNVDHCQAIAKNYVRNVETLMLTAMGRSSFELPALTQG